MGPARKKRRRPSGSGDNTVDRAPNPLMQDGAAPVGGTQPFVPTGDGGANALIATRRLLTATPWAAIQATPDQRQGLL